MDTGQAFLFLKPPPPSSWPACWTMQLLGEPFPKEGSGMSATGESPGIAGPLMSTGGSSRP